MPNKPKRRSSAPKQEASPAKPEPRPIGSGFSVVWKFDDGDDVRQPLEEYIAGRVKEAQWVGALHADRDAKQKRADAVRKAKEAQLLANYQKVEDAFLSLPESLRGRAATSLVCKATGLKADAVREHLTTARARIKAG